MSPAQFLQKSLSYEREVFEVGSMLAVPTDCLYPSNSTVTVYVMGGKQECVVSDNGDTSRVVRSHGVALDSHRWLKPFCVKAGLEEKSGHIISPPVQFEDVSSAIALVANAASTAARHAVSEFSAEKISLKDMIYKTLRQVFAENRISTELEVSGRSHRLYKPDFFVTTGEDSGLIVDSVTLNANSINATGAAHFDIGQREKHPRQTIVFDDHVSWPASDISFLKSTTAELVPFRKLRSVLTTIH